MPPIKTSVSLSDAEFREGLFAKADIMGGNLILTLTLGTLRTFNMLNKLNTITTLSNMSKMIHRLLCIGEALAESLTSFSSTVILIT